MSSVEIESPVPGLCRQRMSFEEWQRLPEKPKAEWVNGWAVWSVMAPTPSHGRVQFELSHVLGTALPGLIGYNETFLQVPGNRIRLPDIALTDHEPDPDIIRDPPVLVVEILSPSTRGQDTVTKAHEYATAGIGQYWLLDPEEPRLDVYELVDGGWQLVLVLDAETPTGAVRVFEHGTVEVDLRTLGLGR